ncbi:MAG TPA: oxidoreductase family protein [Pyrinomonadaceae bacterium]
MITEPEEVTPGWLTEVLRREEVIADGEVSGVAVNLKKELFVSRVARLGLTYSAETPSTAPSSLFLKLSKPSAGDVIHDVSVAAEAEFYGAVGAETKVTPLIRCYDAAYTNDRKSSSILLEDLSDSHTQPEAGQTPSLVDTQNAVAALGSFHARWMDHPKLGNGIGKIFDAAWLDDFVRDLERSVTKFVRELGSELTPAHQRAFEFMLSRSRSIWGRLTDRAGLTVTHGDVHWWNFLYPQDPTRDSVRLFDWQLWHIDLGARDLAFLLALGGFADRRSDLEDGLVQHYYDTLLEHGVRGYEWETFQTDYRLSAVRNLNIPVIFWSQGRDRELWSVMLKRSLEAYYHLNCEDLLSRLK